MLSQSRVFILTKVAVEGYSNLPHYLINCEETKPPVVSERNTTQTRDNSQSLHNSYTKLKAIRAASLQ